MSARWDPTIDSHRRAGTSASAASITASRAVIDGNRVAFWNERTSPRSARCSGDRRVTSTPSNRTTPESGVTNPLIISKAVVLPAPFGPMRPSVSPGSTESHTSSTATRSP